MSLISIIIYTLTCYGLSAMIVYFNGPFDIIKHIRDFLCNKSSMFNEMLNCMFCTPTNVGLWISLINILLLPSINITPFMQLIGDTSMWWVIIPMDAMFTGGTVYIIDTIQNSIERTNKNI